MTQSEIKFKKDNTTNTNTPPKKTRNCIQPLKKKKRKKKQVLSRQEQKVVLWVCNFSPLFTCLREDGNIDKLIEKSYTFVNTKYENP